MSKKKPKKGFWYWMTLTKPSQYWLAKSIGGDAADDADAAMGDLGSAFALLLVLLVIGGAVYLLLQAIGLV